MELVPPIHTRIGFGQTERASDTGTVVATQLLRRDPGLILQQELEDPAR